MSKVVATVILTAAIWLSTPRSEGNAAVSTGCPVDSAKVVRLFTKVSPLFTGDDPNHVAFRQRHGIPRVNPADAAIVADSARCAMLQQRIDQDFSVPAAAHIVRRGYTVYPMRFGGYWVAFVRINPEPGMAEGGFNPLEVFQGDSLTYVATVMF